MRRFPAEHFLPAEGCHIKFVPRQVHGKGRRGCVAKCQTRAIGRNSRAIRHTHAGGRAVPSEANVIVIIQRRHVENFAIGRDMFGGLDLQLFHNIADPASAKAFPGHHLRRAFAQQRPHGHLKSASIGGRYDADFIICRDF